jgi:hypothetical protein
MLLIKNVLNKSHLSNSSVLWFGYKVFPIKACIEGVVLEAMLRGVALGKWFDYEASDFIKELIHSGFIIWWHYWEMMDTRRWSLVGGGRSPGPCLWKLYLVLGPFCSLSFSLCFLAVMKWAAFLCYVLPPWCSVSQNTKHRAKWAWLKTLKPGGKISLSSFKLILMYFVTVMQKLACFTTQHTVEYQLVPLCDHVVVWML